MSFDYSQVTEVAGERVSREQIIRMLTRYRFATRYCRDKDVLEVGCGSGQGLGMLNSVARTLIGADYTEVLLKRAQIHYHGRIPLIRLDAHHLPFKEQAFDTIILYEAIYYLKHPETFVKECLRMLKSDGIIIICNANKNLPDFNQSPHSYQYFSPPDFRDLFSQHDMVVECYGDCKVDHDYPIQKLLSFIKRTMVRLDLMPKTMRGKLLFKRLVFGKLVEMPGELTDTGDAIPEPVKIDTNVVNSSYKVIFSLAAKK